MLTVTRGVSSSFNYNLSLLCTTAEILNIKSFMCLNFIKTSVFDFF
jgi:hypothetical protein